MPKNWVDLDLYLNGESQNPHMNCAMYRKLQKRPTPTKKYGSKDKKQQFAQTLVGCAMLRWVTREGGALNFAAICCDEDR